MGIAAQRELISVFSQPNWPSNEPPFLALAKVNGADQESHLKMKFHYCAAYLTSERRSNIGAEIGQPERVVRRERENEPALDPVVPQTSPALEPAK